MSAITDVQGYSDVFTLRIGEAAKKESPWQKITVLRLNEKGDVLKPRKVNGDQHVGPSGQTLYMMDARTGDLYWDEPQYVIAIKSALIFLATPVYTIGNMAWNFVKAKYDTVKIGIAAIKKFGVEYKQKCLPTSLYNLTKSFVWEIPKTAITNYWNVLRSPFYGIGMAAAALVGVVCPLEGRKWEALVEKAWHNGISYREDFREKNPSHIKDCFPAFTYGVEKAQAFYLGYCFQPRHNVCDKDIIFLRNGRSREMGA